MTSAVAPRSTPWRLAPRIGAILALALGLVVVRQTDPVEGGWLPPCPLHWLTGWHCPGCGATRALHAVLVGDIGGAFSQNPLLMVLVPAILAICLWHWVARGSATAWALAVPPVAIWITLGIVIAFGVARNLPLYPFNLLAPH